MGTILEIVNRAAELTQSRLENKGGSLIEVLNEELEKEKQDEGFNILVELEK